MSANKTEIELYWSEPFTPKALLATENGFREDYDKPPGVYIWTEIVASVETLAYVGRATGNPTLWVRQFQHVLNTLGGQMSIPADFREEKVDWRMNYNDKSVVDIVLDKEKFVKALSGFYHYLDCTRVYLAPCDSSLVKTVERNLLFDLRPTRTSWGTRSEPSDRLTFIHHNATWLACLAHQDSLVGHRFK